MPSPFFPGVYHALMDLNFRRLGPVFYRTRCEGCDQCRMLRIRIGDEKVDLLLAHVGIECVELVLERALQMAVILGDRQFGQTDDVAGTSLELSPDLDFLA